MTRTGKPRRRAAPPRSAGTGLSLTGLAVVVIAWGTWAGRLPMVAMPIAALLSLATFVVYWIDKRAAERGAWRTPENTLHLLALVGGWPGAWWAQTLLRHKSHKPSFLATYWVTAALNAGALFAWNLG